MLLNLLVYFQGAKQDTMEMQQLEVQIPVGSALVHRPTIPSA